MTGKIQVRTFRQTNLVPPPYASEVDNVSDAIWSEVNTFLLTLDPQNVLDIKTSIVPASKYGVALHYEVMVIYLEV